MGHDNPDTMTSQNGLADAYLAAGRSTRRSRSSSALSPPANECSLPITRSPGLSAGISLPLSALRNELRAADATVTKPPPLRCEEHESTTLLPRPDTEPQDCGAGRADRSVLCVSIRDRRGITGCPERRLGARYYLASRLPSATMVTSVPRACHESSLAAWTRIAADRGNPSARSAGDARSAAEEGIRGSTRSRRICRY